MELLQLKVPEPPCKPKCVPNQQSMISHCCYGKIIVQAEGCLRKPRGGFAPRPTENTAKGLIRNEIASVVKK